MQVKELIRLLTSYQPEDEVIFLDQHEHGCDKVYCVDNIFKTNFKNISPEWYDDDNSLLYQKEILSKDELKLLSPKNVRYEKYNEYYWEYMVIHKNLPEEILYSKDVVILSEKYIGDVVAEQIEFESTFPKLYADQEKNKVHQKEYQEYLRLKQKYGDK